MNYQYMIVLSSVNPRGKTPRLLKINPHKWGFKAKTSNPKVF
jgi:hypothetical protein